MSTYGERQARPARARSTLIAGRPGYGSFMQATGPTPYNLTGYFVIGRSIVGGPDILAPHRQEVG